MNELAFISLERTNVVSMCAIPRFRGRRIKLGRVHIDRAKYTKHLCLKRSILRNALRRNDYRLHMRVVHRMSYLFVVLAWSAHFAMDFNAIYTRA